MTPLQILSRAILADHTDADCYGAGLLDCWHRRALRRAGFTVKDGRRPTAVMEDNDLTTTEAAKAAQLSPSTIVRAIRAGKLPSRVTPGGHHRVRLADVQALMGVAS